MKVEITRGSDNVFGDLGFSAREARHLMFRAKLLLALQQAVASRRIPQRQAARMLGISQPRVSNLLRGRIDLFSTDALIDLLARVGIEVQPFLKLKKKPGRVA